MRTRLPFAILFAVTICSTGAIAQTAPATQPLDPAVLEKQFEATLTDATLVGHFTITGSNAPPKEDRYHIVKVTKQQQDGNWLFQARMRYAGRELLIPLVIPVKWAGDTAVIQVTGMRMPGGSGAGYSSRVLIYGDQYAGTWSSPKHSGHLFGRIERSAAATQPTTRHSSAP